MKDEAAAVHLSAARAPFRAGGAKGAPQTPVRPSVKTGAFVSNLISNLAGASALRRRGAPIETASLPEMGQLPECIAGFKSATDTFVKREGTTSVSALLRLRRARAKAPLRGQLGGPRVSRISRRRIVGNKLSPGYLLGTARSVAV